MTAVDPELRGGHTCDLDPMGMLRRFMGMQPTECGACLWRADRVARNTLTLRPRPPTDTLQVHA